MPTLEQRPTHVLAAMAERERNAALAYGLDAFEHRYTLCRIVAILQERRRGILAEPKHLRVEVL